MDFVKHTCSKNRVVKQICNCMSEASNRKTWSLKSGLCKGTLVKRRVSKSPTEEEFVKCGFVKHRLKKNSKIVDVAKHELRVQNMDYAEVWRRKTW